MESKYLKHSNTFFFSTESKKGVDSFQIWKLLSRNYSMKIVRLISMSVWKAQGSTTSQKSNKIWDRFQEITVFWIPIIRVGNIQLLRVLSLVWDKLLSKVAKKSMKKRIKKVQENGVVSKLRKINKKILQKKDGKMFGKIHQCRSQAKIDLKQLVKLNPPFLNS